MPDLTPHNIELIVHSQDRVGLTTAVNNPIKVEFQYNPEALVLPQFTNTMEMGYFFYSTEPFAVYIHSTENDMTIEMTLFDPIACDNSDPSPIHDMMSFLVNPEY